MTGPHRLWIRRSLVFRRGRRLIAQVTSLSSSRRLTCTLVAALVLAGFVSVTRADDVFQAHDEYIYAIEISRKGNLMVTAAGDNRAIIWDAETHERQQVLKHDSAVYTVAISPDATRVATAGGDGVVTIWNVADGTVVATARHHHDSVYCLAYAPGGQFLASAGGSTDGGDTVVRICRTQDLEIYREFAGHERQVYGVAYSPDGRLLATGSSDSTIRLWNLQSGEVTVLKEHTSDVYRCDFTPDGRHLASTSQDGSVRIWKVGETQAVIAFAGTKLNPMYTVTYAADGRRYAAVGDDRHLRVWDSGSHELLFDKRVASRALYAAAFCIDASKVVVAGEGGRIHTISVPITKPSE